MSITEALNPFGRSIRKYCLDTGTEYPLHLKKTVEKVLHSAMVWMVILSLATGFVLGKLI